MKQIFIIRVDPAHNDIPLVLTEKRIMQICEQFLEEYDYDMQFKTRKSPNASDVQITVMEL